MVDQFDCLWQNLGQGGNFEFLSIAAKGQLKKIVLSRVLKLIFGYIESIIDYYLCVCVLTFLNARYR